MSAVLDVGDATELTYSTVAGALVTMDWIDPNLQTVTAQKVVPPDPDDPTRYPVTLVPTLEGMWTARFFDAGGVEDYFIRATSTIGKPPPFAAIGDVRVQYGDLDAEQQRLAAYLIKAASALIRQRFKLIDSQIAAGLIDPDVVALTVSGMVLRVLRNPEGLRSETTGPFTRTYDTTAAAGLLVVTADDAAQLVPSGAAGGARKFPVAGTIRVTPGMAPTVPRTTWGGGGFGTW